jgi:peptidoglycan/LPS O-acetylase OafA/YrhL
MNRLHSLDGLRGLACILVLLHHLGLSTLSTVLLQRDYIFLGKLIGSLTASGVELFFVLSATVLVGPYVRGMKSLNISNYLSRRISRLMPTYIVAWCVAGLAIYLSTNYPTWWTKASSLPQFSLYTWLEQVGIIYFGSKRYNFAWWSLTTEVAFYIILPFLIPVFARLSRRNSMLGGIFVISVLWAVYSFNFDQDSLPLTRDLAIYLSCFCAGLVLACQVPSRFLAHCLCISGFAWTLTACVQDNWNVHVGWGMFYFGVVALAMNAKSLVNVRLSTFLWVWLGERSYSLFLVHYSIIGMVCHMVSFFISGKSIEYFAITRILSVIFSMMVAILIFHNIERRTARNLITADAFWPWSRNPGVVRS